MAIEPTPEQVAALVEKDPGGAINMLNLLKFKSSADYADGRQSGLSGRDAYMLYAAEVAKQIAALGGEFVFASDANSLVVGEGDLEWDMVVIVKYPSVSAFMEMTGSGAYEDIHVHREAGLAHQVLVQC